MSRPASPRTDITPQRPQPRPFLQLSEDVLPRPISTRGQNLPGLLQGLATPGGSIRRNSSALRLPGHAAGAAAHEEEGRRDSIEDGVWMWGMPQVERRASDGARALMAPQMRSQRLIGYSNPRYRWEQYFKTEEELSRMKKPIREYYERNNTLIQQYLYIDKLLDSSLPHDLIQEYTNTSNGVPPTIHEELPTPLELPTPESELNGMPQSSSATRLKRTPKNLYKIPDESTPLIRPTDIEDEEEDRIPLPDYVPDDDVDGSEPVVRWAIYGNMAANAILLVLKVMVAVLTSSVSVLASMVDAALDFLSTAIVWVTTRLISQRDDHGYPAGRRRLEPIGVLVFSVIMITSFFQVALEGLSRLTKGEGEIVNLTPAAIAIMAATVVIKGGCWLWCRLINNSSVQALAQDAATDVVFNTFSIIFPLVGYYARIWWLDSLGGILLALYVIFAWSHTTLTHIRNLSGAAATADERNVLLYLTMRFAKTIKQIQGLQAYHGGDKLIVEVDVVLDENMNLRDSHDLGESLQYVLESVPYVDRAFVHLDYSSWNLPTHMRQQEE
ncbi:hypothetical protein EJ06DRAFT_553517 [Trichodelitschia bisporula]|uniref:Cation efflux protein transmembrane domain-containing protein n=1 Tax=Trichodelitschia bisporula TaxID=703511 RepID=A0A6G1I922_9PEZI|nr:hypothetical protein EJ06DRAFT_553517 [Trichodelitschia bisporula]